MVPTQMFLTRGVGVHKEKLTSFEEALRSAGVAYCNARQRIVHPASPLSDHSSQARREVNETW